MAGRPSYTGRVFLSGVYRAKNLQDMDAKRGSTRYHRQVYNGVGSWNILLRAESPFRAHAATRAVCVRQMSAIRLKRNGPKHSCLGKPVALHLVLPETLPPLIDIGI